MKIIKKSLFSPTLIDCYSATDSRKFPKFGTDVVHTVLNHFKMGAKIGAQWYCHIAQSRIDRNVYGDSHVKNNKKKKGGEKNLGTDLKMIKYGMDNICAKFGEFARI